MRPKVFPLTTVKRDQYWRDEFSFRTSSIAAEGSKVTVTKRYVVHTVGIFDPIGVLAPVVIKFKMFFQVLCEAQVEWDQPLEGDLLTQWHALVSGLSESKPIMLQRCYFFESEDGAPSQLYGFCDASKAAYAAVIYLVKYRRSGQHVTFVAAKTRVAPKRGQTIPRLELLSALLLARLMSKVVSCLAQDTQLDPPVYFSDSQVALHWICGENKIWKQFVQNRVEEIRSVKGWKYCTSGENPADLPSRGTTMEKLSTNTLWLKGPS